METSNETSLNFRLGLLLAAACGFIALAYEIVWMRLFNFCSGSLAPAFAAMLGGYLFGLALGSLLSQRWQQAKMATAAEPRRVLSGLILSSNLIAFLIVPVASWLVVGAPWLRIIPLVMVGSALLGTILPLLCHLTIPADHRAGAGMSYLYLANIIGSGAGSLITGFVLMDCLKLWQIESLLLAGGVIVSAALVLVPYAIRPMDYGLWLLGLGLAGASPFLHDGLYERLQCKGYYQTGYHFADVVESRRGVITVSPGDRFVYGNGIYDGVIETRLLPGSGLIRPYFISALHPAPKEILVIGMSAGAWTQILANHPQAERVTAVEINHGYLKIMARYPQVASVLSNPKVEIHIDDGRRWLRRNPDRQFDVIAMNTSYYWREFASALLSREFLELTKAHLKPGGLVMWNCTESPRAIRTGMEVFPYTLMVGNNCVGSLTPLVPDRNRWAATLRAYRIDGQPVFDLNTVQGRRELEQVLGYVGDPAGEAQLLTYRPEMQRKYGAAELITDDNLGDEYPISLKTFFRILFLGLARGDGGG